MLFLCFACQTVGVGVYLEVMSGTGGNSTGEKKVGDAECGTCSALDKVEEALRVCEGERKEFLDGWKRAKADALNEKKRQRDFLKREQGSALEKSVLALLPVFDSIRAAHGESSGVSGTTAVQSGLERVYAQCLRSFTDLGVVILDTVGESFDPHCHQSVGERHVSSEHENNTVVSVLRVGASIGGSVIRPAMVHIGVYENKKD